jgi:hypothetical protein
MLSGEDFIDYGADRYDDQADNVVALYDNIDEKAVNPQMVTKLDVAMPIVPDEVGKQAVDHAKDEANGNGNNRNDVDTYKLVSLDKQNEVEEGEPAAYAFKTVVVSHLAPKVTTDILMEVFK